MVSAIIPSAGRGKRFGKRYKLFQPLGDKPVLVHTLRAISLCKFIVEIILIVRKDRIKEAKNLIKKYKIKKVKKIVAGGEERQDSVDIGLKEVDSNLELILIHDGARPFVSKKILTDVINSAKRYGATVCGMPVKDTLKEFEKDKIVRTLERKRIVSIQTPQVFKYDIIMDAHQRARREGFHSTDDAELVERIGHQVIVVPGSYENIKITTPEDLLFLNTLLRMKKRDASRNRI